MKLASRLALIFAASLAACSSTVTNGPSDAATDVAVDGGAFCTLPNGGRCARGASCPAGDGCNTCACLGDSPTASCTLIGCVVPDAGPRACTTSAECVGGETCQFLSPGCGVAGTCGTVRDCAFLGDYCGCDGVTFRDCAGGAVASRYASTGACPGVDAGAGANCDVRTAACDSLPPRCTGGLVNTVAGACWGPCVVPSECAPMRCAADNTCAAPWVCDAAAQRCVYGG